MSEESRTLMVLLPQTYLMYRKNLKARRAIVAQLLREMMELEALKPRPERENSKTILLAIPRHLREMALAMLDKNEGDLVRLLSSTRAGATSPRH